MELTTEDIVDTILDETDKFYGAKNYVSRHNNIEFFKFAYQPVFLPHFNIVAQLAYAARKAKTLSTANTLCLPLLLLVDYDIAKDRRCWRSDLPLTNDKSAYLYWGMPKTWRDCVRTRISIPYRDSIRTIMSGWDSYCKKTSPELSSGWLKSPDWSSIWPDYKIGTPASEFLAYSYRYVTEKLIQAPFAVARLSKIRSLQRTSIIKLAEQLCHINESYSRVWTICNQCGRRLAVKTGFYAAYSHCKICDSKVPLNDDGWPELLIPGVIIDNILDYQVPSIIGGTSYWSSLSHIATSFDVSRYVDMKMRNEIVWKCSLSSKYFKGSPLAKHPIVENGKACLAYWLATMSTDNFRNMLMQQIDKLDSDQLDVRMFHGG